MFTVHSGGRATLQLQVVLAVLDLVGCLVGQQEYEWDSDYPITLFLQALYSADWKRLSLGSR